MEFFENINKEKGNIFRQIFSPDKEIVSTSTNLKNDIEYIKLDTKTNDESSIQLVTKDTSEITKKQIVDPILNPSEWKLSREKAANGNTYFQL